MVTYKLLSSGSGIIRVKDGIISHIPDAELNSDWQEYQEWLALGNTPEDAE